MTFRYFLTIILAFLALASPAHAVRGLFISKTSDCSDVKSPEGSSATTILTYCLPGTGSNKNQLLYWNGTSWAIAIVGGSGGAPTTSDYLVGTIDFGLSNEIVVGTTPSGELGGTWASPTVDATHSGSSHAGIQSAAEATAAAALNSHLTDTTDAHDASAISVVPQAGIASTNVQAALEELQAEIGGGAYSDELAQDAIGTILVDSATIDFTYTDATPSITASVIDGSITAAKVAADVATQAELDAHVNDTSAAHAASAISVNSTTLVGTGTDAQAVFEELDNAIVATENAIIAAEAATAAHIADTSAAHAASAISVTPFGTIAATTVQTALEEIVAEVSSGDVTEVQGTADEIAVTSGTGPIPVVGLASTLNLSGKTLLGGTPLVLEGTTSNTFQTSVVVTDPTADRNFTLPNADSVAVQPNTCSGANKVSAISALGVVTCTADNDAGGDLTEVQGTTNEIAVATGTGPVPVISLPATVDLSSKALIIPGKATASLPTAAGSVARDTSTGMVAIGDGTNATLPEQKSQKIFNVIGPPFNAKGDGKVATDCSMTAASATLTCTASHFVAADVGKVIAVYGAGPTTATFLQPLSSTIATYVSGTEVTLANAATTTVTNSERVVWGTNNTTAIAAAVDAAADNLHGEVRFPPGHYLAQIVNLPCAAIGTFVGGVCSKAYNNITISGAGRGVTTIENWDIAYDVVTNRGLIELGRKAGRDAGNSRLDNIIISGLTIRQVKNPTIPQHAIWSFETQNVVISHNEGIGNSHECFLMGGGFHSTQWQVFDNVMGPCGNGGPGYSNATSALNLPGAYILAYDNIVRNSGQAIEAGGRHGVFKNNQLFGPAGGGFAGINIGSTGSGIWDITLLGNEITGYNSAIQVSNSIGTVNRVHIIGNHIQNGSISLYSGQETNSVSDGETDDTIHGISTIANNVLFYDSLATTNAISIGEAAVTQSGLESVTVEGNVFQFTKQFIEGGVSDGTVCTVDTADGTCRVRHAALNLAGPYGNSTINSYYPTVVFADNTIQGPQGAFSSAREINLLNSTVADRLRISGLKSNYPITITGANKQNVGTGYNYWDGNICAVDSAGNINCAPDAESVPLVFSNEKIGVLPGAATAIFTTPDSAAASITGDIDLRAHIALQDWTPGSGSPIISKWGGGANSYLWYVRTDGKLDFYHNAGAGNITATSSVATGFTDGTAHWIRVTLDVNNGASGHDVKFFTSEDGLVWSQLGSTKRTAGVTSIADTTAIVRVGNDGDTGFVTGKVLRAQIYNGIDGTLAVDFNPTSWSTGSTWVSDTTETWTIAGNASVAGMSLVTNSVAGFDFETAGSTKQFEIAHTASAVNNLRATGAATGSGPTLSAVGTDTNVPINLTPKGSGKVNVVGDANVSGLTASRCVETDASKNLVSTAGACGAGSLSATDIDTSAEIAAIVTDETGSGALVFGTSPAFTTSMTTGSTTFSILNTTATTVNAFGAATTFNLGTSAAMVLNFGGSTTASEFRFLEPSASGVNYTALKAQAQAANITYTLPAAVGAAGTFLKDVAGDGVLTWAVPAGVGDVVGPASATDECFARFDTTTGKLLQNSVLCATDAGVVTAGAGTTAGGSIKLGNATGDTAASYFEANSGDGASNIEPAYLKLWSSWATKRQASIYPCTDADGVFCISAVTPVTDGTNWILTTSNTATLTNKTFDTAGTGNSFSINGVAATANTGTGAVVRETSPTLVTPALGTPSALVGTNITGTAAGLTAGNVTTNANLTGHVTSTGNAAVLGSFTVAQLNTAISDADVAKAGAVGSSDLTMNTARLLGRTTAAAGAIEEITVGAGLSLSAGSLTASGSGITSLASQTGATQTITRGAGIGGTSGTDDHSFTTASQEAGFLADGGVTSLTCGAANQGKMQVLDGGDLEWCDGATTSVLQTALRSGGPLGTPSSGTATNLTGTAAGLTAGTVTTNANLTGHVTSTGNAAVLGSFTIAQLNTAVSDADVAVLSANSFTGAQTITAAAPQVVLGVNATTLGALKMFGNTSGDATIQPPAVAGTATVITLPGATGTLLTTTGSAASLTSFPTLNQNTTGSAASVISAAADPADTGVVRLGNTESICWETATPGADKCVSVNSSDAVTINAGVRASNGTGVFQSGDSAVAKHLLETGMTATSGNEWGLNIQTIMPSFSVPGALWKSGVLNQADCRFAHATLAADCSAMANQIWISGPTTARAHGSINEAYVANGSDGLLIGTESSIINTNGSEPTSVDDATAKINYWGSSHMDLGLAKRATAFMANANDTAGWYDGIVLRNIVHNFLRLHSPATAGAIGLDMPNHANWGASIIIPNAAPIQAYNAAGSSTTAVLNVTSGQVIAVGQDAAGAGVALFQGTTNRLQTTATGVDVTGNLSVTGTNVATSGDSATAFFSTGTLETSLLAADVKVLPCEATWGSKTAGAAALANDDDLPFICSNLTGSTITVASVECLADAADMTMNVSISGGASILTGNVTCGNGSFSAATLSGTPTQSNNGSLDLNVISGGTAKYAVMRIKRTL